TVDTDTGDTNYGDTDSVFSGYGTGGTVTLGISPCPNDTYAFDALVNDRIDVGFDVDVSFHDVATLNELASEGRFDLTKISFNGLSRALDSYGLLRSGAALGEDVGPIVVAREDVSPRHLSNTNVVVPGKLTTANLLLELFDSSIDPAGSRIFSEIMPAVRDGEYDAGLVIHEGRFTYRDYGLKKILDLGRWWGETVDKPVPLGGIAAKRSLDDGLISEVEKGIAKSIRFAMDNPDESREYVLKHAQEMEDEVIERHIDLYVNEYTINMGDEGVEAVKEMYGRGRGSGIVPDAELPLMAVR
ncbi:MAG: 1,4-dihydroxy-6-naphthoate synthase, partial [Halobacteria archaeon]